MGAFWSSSICMLPIPMRFAKPPPYGGFAKPLLYRGFVKHPCICSKGKNVYMCVHLLVWSPSVWGLHEAPFVFAKPICIKALQDTSVYEHCKPFGTLESFSVWMLCKSPFYGCLTKPFCMGALQRPRDFAKLVCMWVHKAHGGSASSSV